MTVIPQCMYCRNAIIQEKEIICKKYKDIPRLIKNGDAKCKYHEKFNILY